MIEPMTEAERSHLLAWLGGQDDPVDRLGGDRIAPAVQKIVAFIGADPDTLAGWRRFWALRPEHAPPAEG
jgi:hypothetical protein